MSCVTNTEQQSVQQHSRAGCGDDHKYATASACSDKARGQMSSPTRAAWMQRGVTWWGEERQAAPNLGTPPGPLAARQHNRLLQSMWRSGPAKTTTQASVVTQTPPAEPHVVMRPTGSRSGRPHPVRRGQRACAQLPGNAATIAQGLAGNHPAERECRHSHLRSPSKGRPATAREAKRGCPTRVQAPCSRCSPLPASSPPSLFFFFFSSLGALRSCLFFFFFFFFFAHYHTCAHARAGLTRINHRVAPAATACGHHNDAP